MGRLVGHAIVENAQASLQAVAINTCTTSKDVVDGTAASSARTTMSIVQQSIDVLDHHHTIGATHPIPINYNSQIECVAISSAPASMLFYVSQINTEQFSCELAMHPDREKSQYRGSTGMHILEKVYQRPPWPTASKTPLPRIAREQIRNRMVKRVVDELERQTFL